MYVFTNWDEFYLVPIALLIFLYSPIALRWYDASAGNYDVGMLQKIFFVIVIILVGNGFSYFLTWLNSRASYNRLDTDNPNLTEWQKELLARCKWLGYFLAFILLMAWMK